MAHACKCSSANVKLYYENNVELTNKIFLDVQLHFIGTQLTNCVVKIKQVFILNELMYTTFYF